jgi:hypothetical protein
MGAKMAASDDKSILDTIAGYNRDDCVATLKLRGWLEERRVELEKKLGRKLPRRAPKDEAPTEKLAETIGVPTVRFPIERSVKKHFSIPMRFRSCTGVVIARVDLDAHDAAFNVALCARLRPRVCGCLTRRR